MTVPVPEPMPGRLKRDACSRIHTDTTAVVV
jgi:hypothetical protein